MLSFVRLKLSPVLTFSSVLRLELWGLLLVTLKLSPVIKSSPVFSQGYIRFRLFLKYAEIGYFG